MQSTINTFTQTSDKGRWVCPYEGYQILTENGVFLPDGHFLNPEGIYEDDLNGYIAGDVSISEIDDSLNWFYNTKVEAQGFDSKTEYAAKEVYENTCSRNQFENMTQINFDSKELVNFVRNIFFNSSRKGYTAPCVFNGWNIAVMPAGGDISARKVMETLNAQECNQDIIRATKFRTLEHQNLKCIVSEEEFAMLNNLQKQNICDATLIVYHLDDVQ